MVSSLRNFILALFISLVLFGAGAYYLVGWISGFFDILDPDISNGTENINGEENSDYIDNINNNRNSSHLTLLIVGIDDGQSQMNEKQEADLIYLVDINSNTQKLMISPIPCETKVNVRGYILRLGMVMAEYGIEMLADTVKSYTGVTPDYYCVFDYENIIELMELFGEVEFDVPMDMFYMPERYPPIEIEIDEETGEPLEEIEEQEPEIDLERGIQFLDGEKTLQLFRYKDYSNGNLGRISVQMDFIKEFIRQKVTREYYENAMIFYNALKESIVTNMKELDFAKYMELIFSVSMSSYEQVTIEYPGQMVDENGAIFYNPSHTTALRRYNDYRKVYTME